MNPPAASRMSGPMSAGEGGGACRRGGAILLRQREAGDHLAQLLARGDMSNADLAQLLEIEQGEALGEELAIDDPLAEARNDPEADPPRQLVQRIADAAHVPRLDMLHPVPQHDPVDAC